MPKMQDRDDRKSVRQELKTTRMYKMWISKNRVKWLMPLMIILSIQLASANYELIVINSSQSVNAYQNIQQNGFVNLLNNGSETIYNITCSNTPTITFGRIINMTANEIKQLNYTLSTTAVFSTVYTSICSFLYLTPYTQPVQAYNVSVNSLGFNPTNTDIIQDSTVTWTNIGSESHSVTSLDYTTDITIAPTAQTQKTFNNIGVWNYFDKFTSYGASLNIIPRTNFQSSHNGLYDKYFIIYLNSLYSPSDLNLEIFIKSFTNEYNDHPEGTLKIQNNKNVTVYNITIEGAYWINFSINNFNLNPSDYKIVNFVISSNITYPDQTGKTYNIPIVVKSINANQISDQINIFIKKRTSFNETSSCVDWVAKKAFCDSYPISEACITEPVKINVSQVIYQDKVYPYEYTWTDIDNLKTATLQIPERLERSNNLVKEASSSLQTASSKISTMEKDLYYIKNQTIQNKMDIEKRDAESRAMGIGVLAIIIILVIFGTIGYKIIEGQKKQVQNHLSK